MKILIFSLMFLIYAPSVFAEPCSSNSSQYRCRHTSDSGSSGRRYSSENSGGSRHQRYQSKPYSERQRFDQNLNRYNRYSPQEKRQAQEKWKSFKEETTPEERKFIMEKMRNQQNRGR